MQASVGKFNGLRIVVRDLLTGNVNRRGQEGFCVIVHSVIATRSVLRDGPKLFRIVITPKIPWGLRPIYLQYILGKLLREVDAISGAPENFLHPEFGDKRDEAVRKGYQAAFRTGNDFLILDVGVGVVYTRMNSVADSVQEGHKAEDGPLHEEDLPV